MHNPITVDFAVIDQLKRETSEALVRELLSEFCESLPGRIDQCREALAVDEHVLIARSAHMLKSEAETFGAQKLGRNLQRLETASSGGETTAAIQQIVDEAATLADAYCAAVTQAQF